MIEKIGSGFCRVCKKEVRGVLEEVDKLVDGKLAGEVIEVMYFDDFCGKPCRDAFRVGILKKMNDLLEHALFGVVCAFLGDAFIGNGQREVTGVENKEELMQYLNNEVSDKYYAYMEENLEASSRRMIFSYDILWKGEWKQPKVK